MNSNQFKRNVMRTVSARMAKAGLHNATRKVVGTNVLHAIVGLNTEVGALLQSMQPFLLGNQMKPQWIEDAYTPFGGVSYYVMMLAKSLKLKIPGSGKKVKLVGMTKTEGLLALNNMSVDLLYHAMAVLQGNAMDFDTLQADVSNIIGVLWPLMFDLLGVPPAVVFENYCARLEAAYPQGLFSNDKDEVNMALVAVHDIEMEQIASLKPVKKAAEPAEDAAAA